MQKTLNQLILTQATGFRIGVTLPFQEVEMTFSDICGLFNVSLPEDSIQPWKSASGSIHRDRNKATIGAIAEAMERYSAAVVNFPVKRLSELIGQQVLPHSEFALFSEEQYQSEHFIWKDSSDEEAFFGEVFSLYNNEKVWVPQELIGLGTKSDRALIPSTSTGLAAHVNTHVALLLAVQELLERDALTTYWMNSLGGRELTLSSHYLDPVVSMSGEVFCFDITQQWNPHPVVLVCGYLKQRNKKRFSMGVACRETYEMATEKAYVEWVQGAIFAGYYDVYHPNLVLKNVDDLVDFDEHAVYYTLYPELWDKIPLLQKRIPSAKKPFSKTLQGSSDQILKQLLCEIQNNDIRLYYRDLTLPDVREAGLTVVRVLSPELSLIHGDERAPFLGGRTRDVLWRYPDLVNQTIFPNPYPHPLG
ncbi:MAG: YcaO-like family protein [bacterium]